MQRRLDFRAVIATIGSQAVDDYCTWMEKDERALECLANSDVEGVVDWFRYYGVLQGITARQRTDLSAAVVKWAKARVPERDLSSARLLDEAHKEMTRVCVESLGRERAFTSFASKALWLCYPQQVPIYDSFARRALCVLGHLEENIQPIPRDLSDYGRFAHVWKHFFDTYSDSMGQVDMKSCRFPVRVLDVILLRLGEFD